MIILNFKTKSNGLVPAFDFLSVFSSLYSKVGRNILESTTLMIASNGIPISDSCSNANYSSKSPFLPFVL